MSTDQPEGTEPQRGSRGRTPRVGDSRSPVGSTLSIILAVIAVVAGFFILRELTDDDGTASAPGTAADTDSGSPDPTDAPTGDDDDNADPTAGSGVGGVTTTPAPAGQVFSGATIAVANASGVGGSAGTMSSALTTAGYEGVGDPGNSTGDQLSATIVHYVTGDAAAQAVAQSIATDLGGVMASPMPETRPVDGEGDTSTATVLILLGTDTAGQSLSDLSGASAVEPPAVVGGSTDSSVTETTG